MLAELEDSLMKGLISKDAFEKTKGLIGGVKELLKRGKKDTEKTKSQPEGDKNASKGLTAVGTRVKYLRLMADGDALRAAGAVSGDEVRIGDVVFEFQDEDAADIEDRE